MGGIKIFKSYTTKTFTSNANESTEISISVVENAITIITVIIEIVIITPKQKTKR